MPHGPQRTEAMKKAEMLRSAANMDFFRRQRTGEGRASQVPGLKDLQRGPLDPIPYRRQASPPAITRHISPDPYNADAALLLLGIAAPNPARAEYSHNRAQLLLEPWSVQAAIHRRRGGQRLTDRERAEIRRCTRDPDCIRWPRGPTNDVTKRSARR